MRTIFRSLIAAAVLVAIAVPSLANAAPTVPIHDISAQGGPFLWTPTVHNATTCTWWSSPKVPGFDATVKCENGKVARTARFAENTSPKAKSYLLTLTVRGKSPAVWHLQIVEAGEKTPVNCTVRLVAGSCNVTFRAPDDYGAITLAVGGVLQNVDNPAPASFPTPVGDQLDEVTLGMTAGRTGIVQPGLEVGNFALALADSSQGTLSTVTFDSSVPYAMGALKAVAPNASFGAAIYFNVPIGSKWSSVNYDLNATYVIAF
jgi:hypothetical protein